MGQGGCVLVVGWPRPAVESMVDARVGLDLRLTDLRHLFLYGGDGVAVDVVVFFGEVEQRRASNPFGLIQALLDAAG